MADADGIVDGCVLQGEVLGVDEVIDAVVRMCREVMYEPPPTILLRNNTNTRTAEVAVWGSVEGASHSILGDLFLEGLVNYLRVL